jgi:hypothetical protein
MFSRLSSHVIDRGYAHCGPQYQYEAQPAHLANLISDVPEQRQKSHRRPLPDESNKTTMEGTSRTTEPGLISFAATALSRAVACASRRTWAGSSSNDEDIRTNCCKQQWNQCLEISYGPFEKKIARLITPGSHNLCRSRTTDYGILTSRRRLRESRTAHKATSDQPHTLDMLVRTRKKADSDTIEERNQDGGSCA